MTNAGIAVGAALVFGVLLYAGVRSLVGPRWGRITLLVGVALVPLAATGFTLVSGTKASSRTSFCLSCHEMGDYGRTLFADNPKALAAVHYQNRLIDRAETCYACHTDYALFGDVKAKMNGLRHVWVHYFGKVPQKIKLYEKYPNYNCLHCHDDARRFQAAPAHGPMMAELRAERTSCLSCHNVAHDLAKVHAGDLWQP
jgi:cytochrome c-type protein NapC